MLIHHRLPRRHDLKTFDDGLSRSAFEEIPLCSGKNRFVQRLLAVIGRKDKDGDLWIVLADHSTYIDSTCTTNLDVQDHYIGFESLDGRHGLRFRTGCANNGQSLAPREDRFESLETHD